MSVVVDIMKYAAYYPVAFIPVLTWTVYVIVALSGYFILHEAGTPALRPMDYIIVSIAVAFFTFKAYESDRWAGVVGAALGLALFGASNFIDVSYLFSSALSIFLSAASVLLSSIADTVIAVFVYAFFAGIAFTMIPVFGTVAALVAGLVIGLLASALSTYYEFVARAISQSIHKVFHRLPPGAMALAALAASMVNAAIEVVIFILYLALTLGISIGIILGSLILKILLLPLGITVPVAYITGLVLSFFLHRTYSETPLIIIAALSMLVADAIGIASAASSLTLAYMMLLSKRRGHRAYTFIAASVFAISYLAYVAV
jgi:hypothetical protein